MIKSDELIDMLQGEPNDLSLRFAKVVSVNTAGEPTLLFDGEDTPSQKKHVMHHSYIPKTGDRVFLLRSRKLNSYILMGKPVFGSVAAEAPSYVTVADFEEALKQRDAELDTKLDAFVLKEYAIVKKLRIDGRVGFYGEEPASKYGVSEIPGPGTGTLLSLTDKLNEVISVLRRNGLL